ncbi:hypothetical protein Lal_00023634 [Lupinus albus]|nr:hypothetical protein Lal_00023634 [Lupinus albus]
MTKFFTIFACLLLTCSISHATFSSSWFSSNDDTSMSVPAPSPTLDCEQTIDNVMGCLSFLMSDDNSKPDKDCCSAIQTAATTNIGTLLGAFMRLCAIIESDQLIEFRGKGMTIPSCCGIKSYFGQCDYVLWYCLKVQADYQPRRPQDKTAQLSVIRFLTAL